MSNPKVSVLLTSYNHERWLRECIESAFNQTLPGVEVIAVDDNSTDGSQQVLREYGDRLTLILNDANVGTYAALNQALEVARGEYSAVLNSDDVWLPDKLRLQVQAMDADGAHSLCHTFGRFIDDDGKTLAGRPMGFDFPWMESGDHLATFIANNRAIASSVMFRTDTARRLGGFDASFKILGDWEMWLRLAEQGTVAFVPEELTLYRVHQTNTIYNLEPKYREEIRIREKYAARADELLSRSRGSNEMREALAHTLACLGSLYSITGRPRDARAAYIRSLRLNPKRFKSVLRWVLTFAPIGVRRRLL
jgi:glycosyltransferase involved in cell wall biosynthesis